MLLPMRRLAYFCLFCAALATSAGAAPQAELRTALTVEARPVNHQSLRSTILATGTVTAWRELQIAAEASGVAVTGVEVEAGQIVKKGDLLVSLNDAVLQAQIAQQKAVIAEARANVATAQANLERGRALSDHKIISKQTFDGRANTLATNKAKLAAAEAALGQLQVQLAQTRIVAPAGGLISNRAVNIGQVVSIGTELVRIVQDHRLEVDALVAEADLLTVKDGQGVTVIGPSGERSEAHVRAIAPTVDAKTRLGTVHVALPAGTTLRPGMFARAEIASESALAMTVPQSALVWRGGQASVFLLGQDNIVAARQVRTGRRLDGNIEITAGLSGDETVVTKGAGFLNDGDLVKPEQRSASAQAAAQ
jgi:RND family efflux transporter MFP subunit